MERNQVETNRRLDEVMKSNMNLQNILLFVLNNISGKEESKGRHGESSRNYTGEETLCGGAGFESRLNRCAEERDNSERWWDELCGASEDQDVAKVGALRDKFIAKKQPTKVEFTCLEKSTFMIVLECAYASRVICICEICCIFYIL